MTSSEGPFFCLASGPPTLDPPLRTASVIILFVNFSMTTDSDCYTYKLYKLRRGPKKISGPSAFFLRAPW